MIDERIEFRKGVFDEEVEESGDEEDTDLFGIVRVGRTTTESADHIGNLSAEGREVSGGQNDEPCSQRESKITPSSTPDEAEVHKVHEPPGTSCDEMEMAQQSRNQSEFA